MTNSLTLRGPGEVLAVLPYQLGYHPRRSVVVVCLESRAIGLVMRVDLPPPEQLDALLPDLLVPLAREEPSQVLLVGYEDVPGEAAPLLLALLAELEADGVDVIDALAVRDGLRFSLTCCEACCPPDGARMPLPHEVPAVAELVAMGRAPVATREVLALGVAEDPAASRGMAVALDRCAGTPGRRRRRANLAWARLLERDPVAGGAGAWSPSVLAAAVDGLRDIVWRDAFLGWMAPGVIPREDLDGRVLGAMERALPRWGGMGSFRVGADVAGCPGEGSDILARVLRVVRAVPHQRPDAVAAAAALAAQVAWAQGDGALAREGLRRALEADPDYRLAQLLQRLVDLGVRPPGARPRGPGRSGRSA